MKLRKLILSGFKSFADRTEFEFDDGVSVIVGPNGCGKSNVVDAVKWVLGEQSAKSLRGGEMADVIFNGSSARRPGGHAAVTLEFDNRDGLLQPNVDGEPIACEAVSVTRKLFRSGQSEYLINNQPCRLKDIKEMFLDTGIGTNVYSIIEQGRVSQFLQASQDERRAFFDEAAGISRYKARKKEALRKLERVEQNLLRLGDVMGEVEKRLRSIKYQAGKARNYREYAERLRELRSLFFLSRYHQLTAQRKSEQAGVDARVDELAAMQSRLSQLESSQSSAEVEAGQLEQSSRDLQSQIASLDAQITALQQRGEMQRNRVEELAGQILAGVGRCEELEARIEDCAKDTAEREVQLRRIDEQVERLQNDLDAAREEHAAGELAMTHLQNRRDDEQAGIADLVRRVTQLHNDVQTIGHRRETLHGERDRIADRAEQLRTQLEELFAEHAESKARLGDVEELIADSQKKLSEVQASADGLGKTEQQLSGELADARERRSAMIGRINTLEEMQQRLEGVAEGTRKVLRAREEGKLEAIRGMLGQFIRTDTEHAPLVEAALGGATQRLLVAHYGELQSLAEPLEEILGENGSAEVVCLDRVERASCQDVAVTCPQSVGCVLDWVHYEPWLEPLMWRLLGHTFVVRDLASAALAADVCPEGYRFITLAGEVLEPDGRVRLGAGDSQAGLIARGSELAELRRRLDDLEEQIAELQARCQRTREQREHVDEQLHSLRTTIYEANYERGETQKQLARLEEDIESRKREQPQLAESLRGVEEQIETAVRREHETRQKARDLEELRRRRDEQIAELDKQLTGAKQRQDQLSERRNELRVELASAEQKRLAQRDALEAGRRQQEEFRRQLDKDRAEIELNRSRRTEAEQEAQRCEREVDSQYERREQLHTEAEEVEETRRSLAERLAEIRRELSEKRKAVEQAQQQLSDLRVKLGELDAHVGDLVSRASDEMGMNLNELYADYEHDETRDWDAVEGEIQELRGKIDRLGNVNLDAIDEQQELEQRREFLIGQVEDIQSSQRQLEELIRRLNKESRERFEETFVAVRENFQVIFRKLFGGGKADILLTDPEDVLESGIEIVARPPGKELRSLSLLSGGEKTMAALAMIFSFFRAKPSPFCLLDEVDAALDEANTERYNHLVSEFVDQTQFIMISHAKRTMSVASVLYGVTMQEAGVSRRISVRFEQATRMAEPAETAAVAG